MGYEIIVKLCADMFSQYQLSYVWTVDTPNNQTSLRATCKPSPPVPAGIFGAQSPQLLRNARCRFPKVFFSILDTIRSNYMIQGPIVDDRSNIVGLAVGLMRFHEYGWWQGNEELTNQEGDIY